MKLLVAVHTPLRHKGQIFKEAVKLNKNYIYLDMQIKSALHILINSIRASEMHI